MVLQTDVTLGASSSAERAVKVKNEASGHLMLLMKDLRRTLNQ
jgi:hypothetical protein